MLLHAWENGVTHFDIANNYGPAPGTAEITFGRVLREDLAAHRDEMIIASKAGYWGWDGPYGNGILSKIPFKSVETIKIPDPNPKRVEGGYYETRCVLKAKLENGLTVLVIHFGLNPDEMESAVATVVSQLEKEKCVFMGDLNLRPDDAILSPIRAKMKDTADLFEGEKLSFPSDKPCEKIDYIFASPDATVLSADIPEIIASDHRPHIAEIQF